MTDRIKIPDSFDQMASLFPKWLQAAKALIEYAEKTKDYDVVLFENADPMPEPFSAPFRALSYLTKHRLDYFSSYGSDDLFFKTDKVGLYLKNLGIRAPISHKTKKHEFSSDTMAWGISTTEIFKLLTELLNPEGSVMIMTAPTYGLFSGWPKMTGAEIETVELKPERGWHLDPSDLEKKIVEIKEAGKNPTTFFHMNPHNPTGVVADYDEVAAIAEVIKRQGLFVIDDLVYSGTEFGNKKAVPIASVPGMEDSTCTLFSLSKAYAAPKLRAGMAVGTSKVIDYINNKIRQTEGMNVLASLALSNVFYTRASFPISLNEMNDPIAEREDYLSQRSEEYNFRRNLMEILINGPNSNTGKIIKRYKKEKGFDLNLAYQLLNGGGVKGISTVHTPEAGYFHLLDVGDLIGRRYKGKELKDTADVSFIFASQAGVIPLPGELMLMDHQPVVRVTYAFEPAQILKGIYRMKKAIETFD